VSGSLDVFTKEEAKTLLSMLLKAASSEGILQDDILVAFDELKQMRIGAVMLEMALAGRLTARWDEDARELKWHPA